MRKFSIGLGLLLFVFSSITDQALAQHYHITDSIAVGGSGSWDYVALYDGKLYAAHKDVVDVIDLAAKSVIAHIPAHGSHGTAIAKSLGHGFISNGASNTITVFDLATNLPIKEVGVGNDPDAIVFDSASDRIFTMNGHGGNISVLDASSLDSIGIIEVGGVPEFGIADGLGHLFVNVEDKNETFLIDTHSMKIVKRFKLTGGDGPTGISLDRENHRLFVGCHNQKMLVLNSETGVIVATLPIGAGVDATCFDAATHLAFASNRDGTLTVIDEKSPNKFVVQENASTPLGAKTMTLDPATHTLYTSTAQFGTPPQATPEHPKSRPSVIEGTFKIYILNQD